MVQQPWTVDNKDWNKVAKTVWVIKYFPLLKCLSLLVMDYLYFFVQGNEAEAQALGKSIERDLANLQGLVTQAMKNTELAGARAVDRTLEGRMEQAMQWLRNPAAFDLASGEENTSSWILETCDTSFHCLPFMEKIAGAPEIERFCSISDYIIGCVYFELLSNMEAIASYQDHNAYISKEHTLSAGTYLISYAIVRYGFRRGSDSCCDIWRS